jgi:hypothetical protein
MDLELERILAAAARAGLSKATAVQAGIQETPAL